MSNDKQTQNAKRLEGKPTQQNDKDQKMESTTQQMWLDILRYDRYDSNSFLL